MMINIERCIILLLLLLSLSSNAQMSQKYLQATTGFNRIGFFNEAGFKIGIKNNQFKLGLRHYTLDNFFEKNTVGLSMDYYYQLFSKDNKYYFYPGISTVFFMENKTNAQVFNYDYKLINGVGVNLNVNWSLFYQIGFGITTTRAHLLNSTDVTKVDYFNYELGLGVSYRFNKSKK